MFSIGATVFRIDATAGATVDGVDPAGGEPLYHLAYAGGGDGWWPESALFATIEERNAAAAPFLTALKAAALAALADRRWRAETAGTIVNGMSLPSDQGTQAKLTAAVVACVLDNAYSVNWKLADGSFVLLDHAALIAAAQGVRAYVQACFDREAQLAAEIEAAVDAAALAAIDIEAGWPE